MNVIIPGNTTIFEGEWATYWFDVDGILHALTKQFKKGIQQVFGNFEVIKKIAHNQKICLLIYLNSTSILNKETFKVFANQLPDYYKAIALISKSFFAKMVLDFVVRIKRPSIPVKSFTNENEAKQWLKKFA